jgi:two-component system, cell cycle sensor histidine kinase and response regulator CckA
MWPWRKKGRAPAEASHSPAASSTPASRFQIALLNRAHQQAAVSALGQEALTGIDMNTLLDHAAMFVTQTFSIEYASFHRLEPGNEALRCVAISGFPGEYLNNLMPAGPGTMGRYVLDSAEPVIIRDLRRITQFEAPAFLQKAKAISGISLVIHGANGPWGILQAYCKRTRPFGEDDFHFLQSVANIIGTADQRRATEAENAKLAAFAQQNPNPVLEFDEKGTLTYFNEATRTLMVTLVKARALDFLPDTHVQIVRDCLHSRMNVLDVQVAVSGRTLAWSFFPIPSIQRVHAYATDVTERLSLEAQLRQSQKMEAIGQLAAGVAHDFNNILTIMQGLVRKLDYTEDRVETLQQLFDTTERAAAFTRQLLAFSRRQIMQPRVIDVRAVATGISKMLQRLIGEDIVLTVHNPPTLPAIEADPSMIEQVLLNLAVNARDAMPQGGQLIIMTDEVSIVDSPSTERSYVRIRVQDTGCGMSESVKSRIFEPFFTTKEVGKGTGLGLATVFGIVKQHYGAVEVESDLGRGTIFSVLLPACDEQPEVTIAEPMTSTTMPAGGTETILLVEDEPLLRELAQAVLAGAGYTVLQAGESTEAFSVWSEHQDAIDLLITDMVLPGGMNGRDLAAELQGSKPDLKVIYTTGYSPDILDVQLGATNFLQKPYPPEVLARTVRACLDAGKLPTN